MARRPIAPVAGRGQIAPAQPLLPTQTLLPNAFEVPLDQLVPDPGQPRRHFNETALAELRESIVQEGVLQPLLVYEDGALEDGRAQYTIVDGERRYRASLEVRCTLPVVVLSGLDLTDVRIRQLVANLQREELDPLEEALAIRQLMQMASLSLERVAERIGKPKAYIQRRTDLLFDPRLTEAVRQGIINASVAIELRRFSDEQRHAYLERVAAGERLEVAQLREEKRRAREVLFGAGSTRSSTSIASNGAVPVRPGLPTAPSYRIDTAHPTDATQIHSVSDSAARSLRATGVHTTISEQGPRPLHGAEPYRFDTNGPSSVQASGSSDVPPTNQGIGSVSYEDVRRWTQQFADALFLQPRPEDLQVRVASLVRTWRDAGKPSGWGDALLQTLGDRI